MKKILPPFSLEAAHFNIKDKEKFLQGITLIKESLACKGKTLFSSDNMILCNKNYSMLRKDEYREYMGSKDVGVIPKTIVWRTYVLDFLLGHALKVNGDVIELGVLEGDTADFLCKKYKDEFNGRQFYLLGLFEWAEGDLHTRHESLLDQNLYQRVYERFKGYEFVHVFKGDVADTLPTMKLNQIAFAHIDMNAATPELFSLEYLAPKMSEGGYMVFDDYGWWGYSEQKRLLDKALEALNLEILELPTGQGIVFF